MEQTFKSGFVNIIGKPNVGKSTLTNQLVGEKLSIVTPKAQTTRKRAFGIITTETYQLILSDTPGILDPHYELHKNMMGYVQQSLEDADVLLTVSDPFDKDGFSEALLTQMHALKKPWIHVLNKADLFANTDELEALREQWARRLPENGEVYLLSALYGIHTDKLKERLIHYLPVHPAYFPEEDITDMSERFIAAEIIRSHIFNLYKQEIPYSSEVKVDAFKEQEDIIRLYATIFVERDTQKAIIIGQKGSSIKQLGINARKELETFFQKKFFVELTVKVLKDWRNNPNLLHRLGYAH